MITRYRRRSTYLAEMVSVPLDLPDNEANTAGAKGLGEPVTIPTAPAVANAIYNATGVRVTNSAMTPVMLCELFAESEEGEMSEMTILPQRHRGHERSASPRKDTIVSGTVEILFRTHTDAPRGCDKYLYSEGVLVPRRGACTRRVQVTGYGRLPISGQSHGFPLCPLCLRGEQNLSLYSHMNQEMEG